MSPLSHFDLHGQAVMVNVSEKGVTARCASAGGHIRMNRAAFDAVIQGGAKKGDVLGVARIAGIMAAKRTSELIPLCHPVATESAAVVFRCDEESLRIHAVCTVRTTGKTGVEMEALCGLNIALLTIYDMCKAVDRGMEISGVALLEKQGGKSGHYISGGL